MTKNKILPLTILTVVALGAADHDQVHADAGGEYKLLHVVDVGNKTQDHVVIEIVKNGPKAAALKGTGKYNLGFISRDCGNGMVRAINNSAGNGETIQVLDPLLVLKYPNEPRGTQKEVETEVPLPKDGKAVVSAYYYQFPFSGRETWRLMAVSGKQLFEFEVEEGDNVTLYWPVDFPQQPKPRECSGACMR